MLSERDKPSTPCALVILYSIEIYSNYGVAQLGSAGAPELFYLLPCATFMIDCTLPLSLSE
jgi:hypothetical protein